MNSEILLIMVMFYKKRVFNVFGQCFIGDKIAWTEVLCCRTGSNADCSNDQSSFAEAHLAAIDGKVSYTAHIGFPGSKAFWKEKI